MIMRTSAELKQFLYGQGAGLVGIGNMEGIENCRFQTGVAIAVPGSAFCRTPDTTRSPRPRPG